MRRAVDPSFRAERDLSDIYAFIAADSPAAAARFLGAARDTFRFLAEYPGVGRAFSSRSPRLRAVRVWPIHGFRAYLVFYQTSARSLHVVRVVHAARDLDIVLDED